MRSFVWGCIWHDPVVLSVGGKVVLIFFGRNPGRGQGKEGGNRFRYVVFLRFRILDIGNFKSRVFGGGCEFVIVGVGVGVGVVLELGCL